MQGTVNFPAVDLKAEDGRGFRASAAVRVHSILSPMLREDEIQKKEKGTLENYRNHLAFLNAVSGWPDTVTMSLNIFTLPDPEYPMGGRLETAIVLSITAPDKKKAIAEVLARHAALNSLLNNFFPAMEFANVATSNDLKTILLPFSPSVVRGIGRRRENFIVSLPRKGEKNNGKKQGIGFLAAGQIHTDMRRNEQKKLPYCFPWLVAEHQDISMLAEAMLLNPSPLWFQVRLRPVMTPEATVERLSATLHQCEDLLADHDRNSSLLTVQLKAVRDAVTERLQQFGGNVFTGGAFFCSTTDIDEAMTRAVATVISPGPASTEDKDISLYGGTVVCRVNPDDFVHPHYFFEEEPFTPQEVSCMFRIPFPMRPGVPGLPIKDYRTVFAAPALLKCHQSSGMLLGFNIHRGYRNEVRLSVDDRMRHCCILGQTGTGKSTLLSSMIVQDIKAGHGLCLIDPHGDLVEDILNRFPKKRRDDLVLIDFLDQDHVVPLNLLYWQNEDDRDFIIDDLYGWID